MTRSFAAVERFFERLLERPAARLFRAPIQPVQLQRQVERAMESGRVAQLDRTYVPNRFRVLLNPSDAWLFNDERTMLQADLAEAVLRRARIRGYRLVARPEVLLLPSDVVGEGEVSVEADPLDPGLVRFAAAGLRTVDSRGTAPAPATHPGHGAGPGDHRRTGRRTGAGTDRQSALSAPSIDQDPSWPVPERVTALIEIRSRNGQPWAFVFRGGVVPRIGRGMENEIVLPDDRVSRRHGQLTARQGTLVYTDLGSSNGSQVNGVPAREIALDVGDMVRVGNSTLTIRPGA